ncbi:hypothetical protein D4764_01G0001270 [Takifugu flavidus]|uniref:Uncharacterized protein n=1 Tax=Takifugu flavidus TaxID=433684 RepID=A0A5C6PKA9_9TELE|nr:hypothetical protein D4764_01G0001270 [Takifugu flavidus]
MAPLWWQGVSSGTLEEQTLLEFPSVMCAEVPPGVPGQMGEDIGPIGPDRNWKGIGISLLVILVVLSLIGLSIVLLSKGKFFDSCISD